MSTQTITAAFATYLTTLTGVVSFQAAIRDLFEPPTVLRVSMQLFVMRDPNLPSLHILVDAFVDGYSIHIFRMDSEVLMGSSELPETATSNDIATSIRALHDRHSLG